MLKELHLVNVGPCSELDIRFRQRLNLITGDNGLGKSFLLDVAWWAMTRRWPVDLNQNLVSGYMARPRSPGAGVIEFVVDGKAKTDLRYRSTFSPQDQAWTGKAGRPPNPGLVLYAMADGGFAVWDPARNYWRNEGGTDVQDRPPAYVFSPRDVWDGLRDPRGTLCNGLVSDWAGWQREGGVAFRQLCAVLRRLSGDGSDVLTPGPLTRVSLDDVRDIPTLETEYGGPVPVLYASSGVRRILALAYLLVWSWQEHRRAAELRGEEPTRQVVFLIDEVEAHLHPRWQREVVSALLEVTRELAGDADVQQIVATHSPLVMASAEPHFDDELDGWFDVDLVRSDPGTRAEVRLTKRPFERLGDASNWLVSEAFDLHSARSREAEELIDRAEELADDQQATAADADDITERLHRVLGDTDPFWPRWRMAGAHRGWWDPPRGAVSRRPAAESAGGGDR
ncbi:MAG: ATP-binding protein [Gordonia sp. (in: high G+C Gram-positive bacteria)]